MRRVDGALVEIKLQSEALLQSIQQLRDTGQFEVEPEQIEEYQYRADMIASMAKRLYHSNNRNSHCKAQHALKPGEIAGFLRGRARHRQNKRRQRLAKYV
jgi:hypothetical protein